jgi:hypothetical protein
MIYDCFNLIKSLVPNFNNFRQKFFNKKVVAAFLATLALATCTNAAELSCDYIYGIREVGDDSVVYKYNSMTQANINSGANAFEKTDKIFKNTKYSTLAIGYWFAPGSEYNGVLTAYRWQFTGWTIDDNTADFSKRISYIFSNETAYRLLNYNSTNAPHQYSAGGEVNQLTGELYMSSAYDDLLYDGSFKITVIDITKRTVRSLGFSKEDDSEPTLGQVVSDMIIDAEGNTFVIATDDTSNYLTRLNMKTGKYDAVVKIKGAFSKPKLINAGGMAFLNGRVYVIGAGINYEIDPVSGESSNLGTNYGFSDLASCQLVPLITGRIYNDANGDGVLNDGEKSSGIAGVTVQLYDKNYKLLGEQITKDSGSYSFIVNNTSAADFYIRVKNPTINGEHAAQTWASGGSFSYINGGINTVTNYCTDLINDDDTGSNQNRVCYSKRADSIDSSDNGIANASYYSKVVMNTDKAVVHADFAFAAILDRGDAPASYGEAIHNLGIKGDSGKFAAYLGNGVSADNTLKASDNASGDDFDDGMFVTIDGIEVPLQNAVLMMGKSYNIRADINGTLKNKAYLNAWIGTNSNGGFSSTFETQIADNLNSASGDAIEFTYSPNANPTPVNTFIRTRFSTVKNLSAADTNAKDYPWSFDGEVEDYRVVIAGKQIRVNVKSVNDVGNFSFNLSNVDSTSPSSDTRTIETTTSDVFAVQPYDGVVHAIESAGKDIVISGTSIPSQFELNRSQTNCVDLSSSNPSANLSIDFNANGDITVQGNQVVDRSSIVCNIVYGVQPTLEFVTNIAGRVFDNDNFNISISDISNVSLKSNQTITGESDASINVFQTATGTYLFNQVMASGSVGSLEHYKKDVNCINAKDGGTTVAISGTFPFEINATYSDIIKCTITNSGISADLKTSEIKAEPSIQMAGSNSTITVTVRDSDGNAINSGGDDVVIFMNSKDNMTLTNGTVSKVSTTANVTAVDNGNGTHTAYVYSTITGLANLTFTINGNLGANSATVEFTHSSNIDINGTNGTDTNITANPTSLEAGKVSTITVDVRDEHNNPISDADVKIHVESGVADITSVTNNNNGTYTASLNSTIAGNVTVGFSANGSKSALNTTVEFTHSSNIDINGTNGTDTNITANPSSLEAGKVSIITVDLRDEHNNPISDANVVIYVASGVADITNQVNNNDGTYTANLNSTIAGNVTVGFSANGSKSALNTTVEFTHSSNIDGGNTSIKANPNHLSVTETSLVTVTLVDEFNNFIYDANVELHVNGSATLDFVVNHNNGTYTANLSSLVAENVTVGFKVNGQESDLTDNVEFTHSDNIDISGGNTSIKANPNYLSINEKSLVTVTLVDEFNNPVPDATVTLHVTSGIATTDMVINHNNGTYTANLSSSVAGNVTVGFKANGIDSSLTDTVEFVSYEKTILVVTLNSSIKKAKIGDLVKYTATIENIGSFAANNITLSNVVPFGFSYVDKSIYISNNISTNIVWDKTLDVNSLSLAPGEKIEVVYILRIGAGAKHGTYITTATAYNNQTSDKSNTASASVEITADDPMLDESLIIGTVFNDKNGNMIQDDDEEGLPGVRIFTVEGYIITTDKYGRFHLLNIKGGEWSRGRNFMMKIDPLSLPKGSEFTTANPLVRRITPGIPARFDFGIKFTGVDVMQGIQK